MKIKEIGKYFALSVISMAVLYVWYAVVGVTDLGNWNHGLRNVLAGVIFVFAAQLVTGRSLFILPGGRDWLSSISGLLLFPIYKPSPVGTGAFGWKR